MTNHAMKRTESAEIVREKSCHHRLDRRFAPCGGLLRGRLLCARLLCARLLCARLMGGGLLSLSLGLLLLTGGCPSMQTLESVGLDLSRPTIYGSSGTVGRVAPPPEAGDGAGSNFNPVTDISQAAFEARLAGQYPACSDPPNGATFEAEVLQLVNRERAARGLNALVRSATLERQATQYACEMIHYAFFDHVNPSTGSRLRDRAEQFSYAYQAIGENLAAGQPTPARVMQDWMNSPGHRSNILSPEYTELGVAYRVGGHYTHYWVQEFGRPLSPPPVTAGTTTVRGR